jgi:hypothetical protein
MAGEDKRGVNLNNATDYTDRDGAVSGKGI